MKKSWSRRKFVGAGLVAPLVFGKARALGQTASRGPRPLSPAMLDDLRAAVDEIIPAVDGMPAASEVGSIEYLTSVASRDSAFRAALEDSLEGLRRAARERFGRPFARLAPADRVEALRIFERDHSSSFANFRDDIYESYYTNQRVWKEIGYQFYPTNQAGPHMKPFDESVLANVGKKPRYYREVE